MSTEGNYFCSVNLGKSNIRVSDGGVTHAHKHAGIPLTHHSLLTLTHTTTHHSPLTTHHSLLTLTHTLPLTTHHSLLTLTTRHTPRTQMHTTQHKHVHKHTPLLGLVTSFDIT